MVGLTKVAESDLHTLSGGMRQRVAIARAMALEPEVLLMDEPFSALDAITREELYVELQEVWKKSGSTIVFVTHNVREAVTLGDRVILLAADPGRIQAEFPVNIRRPRHIDDVEVAKTAQQISQAMKAGRSGSGELNVSQGITGG
jgi:NitT/TauT family transport system ATP-binding protein